MLWVSYSFVSGLRAIALLRYIKRGTHSVIPLKRVTCSCLIIMRRLSLLLSYVTHLVSTTVYLARSCLYTVAHKISYFDHLAEVRTMKHCKKRVQFFYTQIVQL